MSEQNNFSCKKSKTLITVVITQAAEISLGWIAATAVNNVISCVDVWLLRVSEDREWLKLKDKAVLVYAANVDVFDENIHKMLRKGKMQRHFSGV
jgi:hypothetical protein